MNPERSQTVDWPTELRFRATGDSSFPVTDVWAEEIASEIDRLRAALRTAADALRNDFEPDNQSRAWHRVQEALNGR